VFHLFIPLVIVPRMKAGRDFRPFLQAESPHCFFDLLNAHAGKLIPVRQAGKTHFPRPAPPFPPISQPCAAPAASGKGIFLNFNRIQTGRIQTGLPFHRTSFNFHYMSDKAQAVIEEFNRLPHVEQLAVYEAIARKVTPADYGPLSDEDLTAIAAETFALLD